MQEARRVAAIVKTVRPEVIVEVSGNISDNNLEEYMDEKIDVISMSCLIQGHPCIDFSLKVMPEDGI